MQRETSGRQTEYEDDNSRKYLRVLREPRHGERSLGRSVPPSHSMPNFSVPSPPGPVLGPVMDMAEYQRSHATWLRQQQENMDEVRGERTSGGLPVCGEKPPDEKRGRILSQCVTILAELPSEFYSSAKFV